MIIFFDFDGTIHKTDLVYKDALNQTLDELSIDKRNIDYKKYIGLSPKQCWDDILNDNSNKDHLIKKTGQRLIENLEISGRLYKNSKSTLSFLKDKYDLYIISKCSREYMAMARKVFSLDKYFKGYLIGEDFNYIEKYKILNYFKEDYYIIGDRREDIEAGYRNNKKSVFASYGYGQKDEGEYADYIISDISELLNII